LSLTIFQVPSMNSAMRFFGGITVGIGAVGMSNPCNEQTSSAHYPLSGC
jgi:hypothetical protein